MVTCRPVVAPLPLEPSNSRNARFILLLAALAAIGVSALALAGDLRQSLLTFWPISAALTLVMLVAWRAESIAPSARRIVIVALLLRLLAGMGDPALSDDVYRFVWDGRVQLAGIHPNRFAPNDAALDGVPDAELRARINHPEIGTIYPPSAQLLFALNALLRGGTRTMRLLLGLCDVAVVALLIALLRRAGRSPAHAVLYGWNPLAVLESSGSGHLEPLGVALLLASLLALERGRALAGVALAASVLTKLLPLLTLPALARRLGSRGFAGLLLGGGAIAAPYLLSGPATGEGLFAYLGRWTHNGAIYESLTALLPWIAPPEALKSLLGWMQGTPLLSRLPYDILYEHVWPDRLARLIVAGVAVVIALVVALRRVEPTRAAYLILGSLVVLAPTVHPWYVLWVLPLAILHRSTAWLWLAATIPLAYVGEGRGVPWPILLVEYGPFALLWIAELRRDRVRG